MSILIKGMEMPTRCGRCDMCVTEADGDIDSHKACCITGAIIENLGEKMEDCPLVPVPPHGRLIDADAALRDGWTISRTYSASPTEMVYEVKTIDCLPTIIPAEEGEI